MGVACDIGELRKWQLLRYISISYDGGDVGMLPETRRLAYNIGKYANSKREIILPPGTTAATPHPTRDQPRIAVCSAPELLALLEHTNSAPTNLTLLSMPFYSVYYGQT